MNPPSSIWFYYAAALSTASIASIKVTRSFLHSDQLKCSAQVFISLGLILVFSILLLIPIDIHFAASTNTPQGIKSPWASIPAITTLQTGLKTLYYTLFLVFAIYSYIGIPFAFVYYKMKETGGYSHSRKITHATLSTLPYSLLFVSIFVVGLITPVRQALPNDPAWIKSILIVSSSDKGLYFFVAICSALGVIGSMSFMVGLGSDALFDGV